MRDLAPGIFRQRLLVEGYFTARIDRDAPSAGDNTPYVAKYRPDGQDTLGSTGLTAEAFTAEYSVPVRVTLNGLRGF